MKTSWTKKELIETLKEFNDDDEILINIHDDVFYEDNYEFYIDPIHMGLDDKNEDRGHQIWLCPVQNRKPKYAIVLETSLTETINKVKRISDGKVFKLHEPAEIDEVYQGTIVAFQQFDDDFRVCLDDGSDHEEDMEGTYFSIMELD